jgi:hypothetical protein
MSSPQPLTEYRDVDVERFDAEIVTRYEPAVLRGLVADWPAVLAAKRSAAEAFDYVLGFDRGAAVEAFIGPPEIKGRFFYRSDMAGFNFERKQGSFGDVVRYVKGLEGVAGAPAVYVGAAAVGETVPGFDEANRLPLLGSETAAPRIWIGNETVVSTHFDLSDNIACVVAGRRRFTLFPPDQVANLYVGPLDFTMAGQPSSMVPVRNPDLEVFPRFRQALAAARWAELEPGDAVYIPALWWHNVEALGPLGILVNHWWEEAGHQAGIGFESMVHAILGIAALPPDRREAWRAMFDHYVFRPGGAHPAEHLRPEHRGILGEPTPQLRQRIRQFLLRGLGRS